MARSSAARWSMVFGIAAAAWVTLAACGDDDSAATVVTALTEPSADPRTVSTATSAGGNDAVDEAVVIEHAFGTTTIDGAPQRIVSFGSQWTGVLLAMGVQPVAYAADPTMPDGRFPWEKDLSADAVAIEVRDSLPLEQIAALEPDLILVTFLADEQGLYDDLAAIAPTVGLLGERQVDTWQDMTEVAGRFLHDPARASRVVDGVEQLLTDIAAELPGLKGKTFALANYIPGDSIHVVADPTDGSSLFFQALGMKLDAEILDTGDGVSGRAEINLEQADLLDADLLVLFSNDGDPHDLVGYERLPAVADGAVAEVDYAPVVGLNTPNPLSIPYSLDVVRPALEEAADG